MFDCQSAHLLITTVVRTVVVTCAICEEKRGGHWPNDSGEGYREAEVDQWTSGSSTNRLSR
jgi:hypothetical protein